MTLLAANVGFLFREFPYLARFRAARDAGFEAVEFAWPPVSPEDVVRAVRDAGVRVALLNAPAGDLDAGERGYANDPGAVDRWRTDFGAALRLAEELDCPVIHVLAGNRLGHVGMNHQFDCLRANLDFALAQARAAGRTLTLELLNPDDTPRYLFTDLGRLRALLEQVGDPALRLQFDTYHVERVTGDVVTAFRAAAPLVAHVQVADSPGRHEPGTGRIDFAGFFAELGASGYDGAIGLEYEPAGGTSRGLGWLEVTPPR